MCENGNGNGNGRLTDKQAMFVERYLECFNATEACRGVYDTDDDNTLASIGSENLRKPKIAERVSQRLQESAMLADEVLMRLAEIARGEWGEYITVDGKVDIEGMVIDGKTHLITEIRDTQYGRVYKFPDMQNALALIGKHHRLFAEQYELRNAPGEQFHVTIDR